MAETLNNYVKRIVADAKCALCGGQRFFEPTKMHALPHLGQGGKPDAACFQLAALTCTGCGLVMFFDPSVVSSKMR